MESQDIPYNKKWFSEGYEKGRHFASQKFDYEELAAIYRAKGIPLNWDIFRAEILNRYLDEKDFHFRTYETGFTQACMEFFEKI